MNKPIIKIKVLRDKVIINDVWVKRYHSAYPLFHMHAIDYDRIRNEDYITINLKTKKLVWWSFVLRDKKYSNPVIVYWRKEFNKMYRAYKGLRPNTRKLWKNKIRSGRLICEYRPIISIKKQSENFAKTKLKKRLDKNLLP